MRKSARSCRQFGKIEKGTIEMPPPLKIYQINSLIGLDHGQWRGRTPAEALAKMHREADVPCRASGNIVVFESEAMRSLCGDVDAWSITVAKRAV
jgi:hypothetical protein